MNPKPILFLVILAIVTFNPAAFSQTYPFTTYTTADGLAQSAVSCFFQDSRGYMWFGTWGGISRYDGQEFWSYRNSAMRVTSICEDTKDTLWVGTTTGLVRFAFGDSVFRRTRTADGVLPSEYIVAILKDRDSNLWVGTDKGLVVFTPGGKSVVFNKERGLQDDYISGLKQDSAGGILIASGRGIMRCRLKDAGLVDAQELLKGTIIGPIIVVQNGDILAGSVGDRTVIRLHAGVWQRVFSCDALGPAVQVRSLGEDEQGNIWIGTTLGLVVVEDGHVIRIPRSQELPNQYIGAIYRDREHVLWFGTEGGAFKLPGTPFRSYNYSTGLRSDHVISIFQDAERNYWLGTYNGAAKLEPDGRTTVFGLSDGLPHLAVHSFAQGTRGSVWIGSWNGLVVCENGRLKPGPIDDLLHVPVIRLLRDPSGAIWCGSRGRIVKATPEGKVLLRLGAEEGIPEAGVCALFIGADGTLWFGTDSRGGGFYRDGKVVLLGERDGLPDPWVMSIGQDRHGALWFGTQHGVVRWNGQRFEPIRTTDEELRTGIVTFVVKDSLGNIWFGTQRGVYRWNDSVTAHLETYDGLIADPTRSGYVDTQGNLWIGTVGGVSRLEMSTFSRKQDAPPIHMEGLALDEQFSPQVRTTFAYDENTLTAHFSSLSFRDERRTEFQWMLAGFDETWQLPRLERHVRYTHLPWGAYEFLVRARNGRTAWSEPARLAFVISPPFWGTWWFLLLSGAGVAGSLLLIYRRRVRSLEKEKIAEQRFSRQLMDLQENERKRIAGELHDSLVQNLLVAKNRSLLGMKNAADPERVTRELSEISSALTDAIDEVREIAHNLRPYQLDRLGLTQALQSLAGKMSESSAVKFSTNIENIDELFAAETSTIIYRIVQESVNNILRHSGASDASIVVKRNPPGVDIIVRDNGGGFRFDQAAASQTAGFGLTSIDQRVKMLGGALTVDSAADVGTTVSVTIPLRTQNP
jgi:signal transduction histidine kinase/ligand-binding sensor domain-containing protein